MSPRSAVAAVGGDRLAGAFGALKLGLILHHQGRMADGLPGDRQA